MIISRLFCLFLVGILCISANATEWGLAKVAGSEIAPGQTMRFTLGGDRSFEGAFIDVPVFVARGVRPGPTLCVVSGIHGDEVNSVEIARRVFAGVDSQSMSGMLVVLPAVNSYGFRTMRRNMPDRRDLNRAFPGNINGSVASIVAFEVFSRVILDCSYLIDLHTGSNLRTNLPQVRVDSGNAEAVMLAEQFGVGIVVVGQGPDGSLRREAMKHDIPAIVYEAGPPYIFVEPEIERGTQGVKNVMSYLGMTDDPPNTQPTQWLERSRWHRVPHRQGGIYLPTVSLGDTVKPGQLLATLTDPLTDVVHEIHAGEEGIVIGMSLPQVLLSGSALMHIGKLNPKSSSSAVPAPAIE
jgi:predicted deacylase